jgi:hypothetical protein
MSHDPLENLLQDWAAAESADQPTPLTPALLRAKHLLAREDARRARARRLQSLVLGLPVLFAALVLLPWVSPAHLREMLVPQTPAALLAILGILAIGAFVGGTWATE